MKILLSGLMVLLLSEQSSAQAVYENNLFSQPEVVTIDSQEQLISYLQNNKPRTFQYFERLSLRARKQVLKQHQEQPKKDLSDIIIRVYRNESRS